MSRKANTLPTLGYFGILGLFIGMVLICFLWGIWEWKKPKDPGPLFIDLDRTIERKVKGRKARLDRTSACENSDHCKQDILGQSVVLSSNLDTTETIRIRGDLRISKGEVIPYNMIVEGDLVSQEDVTFQGGLHVRGRAVIGARNRLEKSIVCQKELILLEDVTIYNCVDCEGFVFIKNGARVGVGIEGGGIASCRTIYLENAEGPLEIHSKERICIVGVLKDVIPDELNQMIEVRAT